jgi:hypothetical protein
MNEVYTGLINKIQGNDRATFSMNITMPQDLSDDDKKTIGDSFTITREEAEENPIFEYWFAQVEKKGYWAPWMQDWTSATIYRFYRGEETINV